MTGKVCVSSFTGGWWRTKAEPQSKRLSFDKTTGLNQWADTGAARFVRFMMNETGVSAKKI